MSKITDWLLRIAAIIGIMLGLNVAKELITQILVIIFISVVVSPVYYWLKQLKFPNWLAILTVILSMVCFTIFGVLGFIIQTIQNVSTDFAEYVKSFTTIMTNVTQWLATHDIEIPIGVVNKIKEYCTVTLVPDVTAKATSLIASSIQQIIVILITVSFIVCELPNMSKNVRKLRWVDDDVYSRLQRVVLDIRHYMGIKTIISAITGVSIYIGLKLLGVPSAEILGLIAFVLNFIPVFGSIVSVVPAVVFAAANLESTGTIISVVLLYLVVNQVLGNILEPKFMGTGFGISPVVVLLAVLVWGAILGPVGMLLAVPLTMAVKSSIDSMDKDRVEKPKKEKSKRKKQETLKID